MAAVVEAAALLDASLAETVGGNAAGSITMVRVEVDVTLSWPVMT